MIDPTGHFTEEAISHHILNDVCYNEAECYDRTLSQWQSDSEFWNMLLAAQAGDVIFASTDFRSFEAYYHFTGEGHDVLTGALYSMSAYVIQNSFPEMDYTQLGLNDIFRDSTITWGGMFSKNESNQIVNVYHRMSETNIYLLGDWRNDGILTSGSNLIRSLAPKAFCSAIGAGPTPGFSCANIMSAGVNTAMPDLIGGPEFAMLTSGVSDSDTAWVSAGHVFRYDAGGELNLSTQQYSQLNVFYYGNAAVKHRWQLIVNYVD